jgi:hypothetical protein
MGTSMGTATGIAMAIAMGISVGIAMGTAMAIAIMGMGIAFQTNHAKVIPIIATVDGRLSVRHSKT